MPVLARFLRGSQHFTGSGDKNEISGRHAANFPRSHNEAKDHINDIRRRQNDQKGNEFLPADEVLKVLAENLYTSPSHFLHELLQNADDADFGDETPKVSIKYSNYRLMIEYNEIGFSKANVEAICSASRSSKKKKKKKSGRKLTGEKGLGFKSVFKVATSVWISSGFYSFRFDRDKELGRIHPIWSTFPGKKGDENSTAILLQIPKNEDEHIKEALKAFDPTVLMFLNILKQLTVEIIGSKERSEFGLTLEAQAIPEEAGVLHQIHCRQDLMTDNYLVFRHTVRGLPKHELRKNRQESELILAFPTNLPPTEEPKTRTTYAALPIKVYGFKFAIQSDFILVSSREDIEQNPWNQALIDNIPFALRGAIQEANTRNADLGYIWPLFLPYEEPENGLFKKLNAQIKSVLSTSEVVQDIEGGFFQPHQLTYAPAHFRDVDGLPLIPSKYLNIRFLADKYPMKTLPHLMELGVQIQDERSFLGDLEHFMSKWPKVFRTMPHPWQEQLYTILLRLLVRYKRTIESLPIVPLANGDWVSPNFGMGFFATELDDLKLPGSIQRHQICADLVQQHAKLLLELGARNGDKTEICKMILKQYGRYPLEPERLSFAYVKSNIPGFHDRQELVEHLEFLYRAEWEPEKTGCRLRCMSDQNQYCKPADLYLPSNDLHTAYSLSSSIGRDSHVLEFLHKDYMEAFGYERKGSEWLEKTLGISKMLRIDQHDNGSTTRRLHNDFRRLVDERPVDALELLKNNWSFYSPRFEIYHYRVVGNINFLDGPSRILRREISDMWVPCRVGSTLGRARLRETYLPRKGYVYPADFKLVQVAYPDDPEWNFLSNFGVRLSPDVEVYISQLRRLRDTNVSHSDAARLYEVLEDYSKGIHRMRVISLLEEPHSIYIPEEVGGHKGSWHDPKSCVWDDPRLKHVPRLKHYYSDRGEIFVRVLGISKANFTHLKSEAEHLTMNDGIGHIISVLSGIAGCLSPSNESSDISKLRIFPVRRARNLDEIVLRSVSDREPWFIPDQPHLQTGFLGLVDLADLSGLEERLLAKLMVYLELDSRLLSKNVTRSPFDVIDQFPLPEYTRKLHGKVPLISSAILHNYEFPANRNVVKHFEQVRVLQCLEIRNSWTLKSGLLEVKSRTYDRLEVTVACRVENEALTIYLVGDDHLAETLEWSSPIDLPNQLLQFFGIHDRHDATLLTQILVHNDLTLLEADLRRRSKLEGGVKRSKKIAGLQPELPDPQMVERDSSGSSVAIRRPPIEAVKKQNPDIKPTNSSNTAVEEGPKSTVPIVLTESGETPVTGVVRPRSTFAEPVWEYRKRRGSGSGRRKLRSRSVGVDEQPQVRRGAYSEQTPTLVKSRDSHTDLPLSSPNKTPHQEFMSMSTGRIVAANNAPTMVFRDSELKDTRYFAELYMSQYLENYLGKQAYKPHLNWTSPMRSLSNHTPFPTPDEELRKPFATFTISETLGKLGELIKSSRQVGNVMIADSCTFHIEVCETTHGLDHPFVLPNRHYRKAEELTVVDQTDPIRDLFIIARVANVHGDPCIALYSDPWRLYMEGFMHFESRGDYKAEISTAAPSVLTHTSVNQSFTTQAHKIYQGLSVGSGKIRLLKLELNGDEEPLRGELLVRNVSDTSFWAISYVWGRAPDDQSPFFETINGKMRITNSLADCLTCLRRRRVTALIWADALCINQNDNVEKAMQVRRMGTLYQHAERVIIWMGSDTENDPPAIKTLLDLPRRSNLLRAKDEMDDQEPDYSHIDSLLQRKWFRRTWIIQELVLASEITVLYGDLELGWEELVEGIEACEKELNTYGEGLISKGPALALSNTRKNYKDGEKFNLLQLLEIFYYSESTTARDKLFALLHLAHDARPEHASSDNPADRHNGFNPDYDDMSEAGDNTILTRYAKEFVKKPKGALDLLCRAGSGKSSSFCTWIPDFMKKNKFGLNKPPVSAWKDSDSRTFSAGPQFNPVVHVRGPESPHLPPILAINGHVFDSIRDCRPLGDPSAFVTVLGVVREYLSHVESYPNCPPDVDCRDQLLLKCLTGDADGPRTSSNEWYETKEPGDCSPQVTKTWPDGYEKDVLGAKLSQNAWKYAEKLSPKSHSVIAQFWKTVAAFLSRFKDAAICTTANRGYVGIVPGASRPGDKVILIPGAKTPLVVRKGDRFYTLIGESYLHSLMYWSTSGLGTLEEEEVCLI